MPDPSITDLTARVERLEQRLDPREPPTSDLGDRFWVLQRLRNRGGSAVVYSGAVELPGAGPVEWQMTHDPATLLAEQWADLAPHLGALGHPVRLRILQLVATGEAGTAAELADREDLGTTGQVYHHLRQLTAAGWLQATSRGRHRIPAERVVPLLVILGACR